MDINKSADGLTLVQFIKAANEDLSNVATLEGHKSAFKDLHVLIHGFIAGYILLSDYKIIKTK